MKNEITTEPKNQQETLVWLEHYTNALHEMNAMEDINSGDFTYIQPRACVNS